MRFRGAMTGWVTGRDRETERERERKVRRELVREETSTDLRLHHRSSFGAQRVVDGDGVTQHTRGAPSAAFRLPVTHAQI